MTDEELDELLFELAHLERQLDRLNAALALDEAKQRLKDRYGY